MRTKVATKPKAMRLLSLFLVFVMLITTQGFTSIAKTVSENEAMETNGDKADPGQLESQSVEAEENTDNVNAKEDNLAQNRNTGLENAGDVSETLPQSDSVSENSVKTGAGTPANPVHHCNTEDGTEDTTTWSYVYFGSYPQSEVTDITIISAIDSAILAGSGTTADAGTDVWVNGTKYRRISIDDTNYDGNFNDVTNNGYRYFKWERIKWRVLDNNGSTLFVVADGALDCKDYNDVYTSITWENSTIRSWLNDSFYHTAFSSNEQNAIVAQNVVNDDNPYLGTEGGNNTTDKVYLLSIDEVENKIYGFCSYYNNWSASRWIQPSNYARARGTSTYSDSSTGNNDNCYWWLRSPGDDSDNAAFVSDYGDVDRDGIHVYFYIGAVLPALHINLSSGIWLMTDDGTSGDGGEAPMLTALTAVKTKTTYNQGESLNVDDLEVTAEYHTDTRKSVNGDKYTTNAKSIDMNTPGVKTLTISYTENNITKTADITITVNKAETAPSAPENPEATPSAPENPEATPSVPENPEATPSTPEKQENPETTYTTVEAEEEKLISTNTDKGDVAGSKFYKLRLKATGKNKSVKLTWQKVKDADGYIIYGARCGKSMKKIKTIKGNKKVTYTQKKLKKGKYYKYMVVAYKNIDGKKYTIATSKSAHAVTNDGKYGNPTKVTVKSSKMTIKVGKKKTIKASYTLPKGKKASIHIAKFRYESTNTKVATVTKKGVVKAKKKGTAYIYVYAQNGVYKKVKVTVK